MSRRHCRQLKTTNQRNEEEINKLKKSLTDEKLEYEHELKEIKERSWSLQNDINTKLEQKEDLVQQLNLDIKRYVGELGKGSQFMHYIHEHDLP